MAPPRKTSPQAVQDALVNEVLNGVKDDVAEIKGTLAKVSESLANLARIEQRQADQSDRIAHLFSAQSDTEKRVMRIEVNMPGLQELRKWVVSGMVAGIGMMFVAVTSLVFMPRAPYVISSTPVTAAISPATPSQ